MWLYAIFAVLQSVFSRIVSGVGQGGALAAILSFILVLMFLPILMFNWLGNKLFTFLNMAISRKAEYRADPFAASLGPKADMIKALEVIDSISVTDNSFQAKLMAAHPAPIQRIGALEDEVIQHQRLGGLIMGTPFTANATDSRVTNSDFISLATILGAVGILWCGYPVYNYYTHPRVVEPINGSVSLGRTADGHKIYLKENR